MIPADVVAEMASLGLSRDQAEKVADMLARVERATEAKAAEAIEARRANDRARKDRQRHGNSREVTGHDVTEKQAGTEIARAPVNPNPSLRSGLLVTPLPSVGPQADAEGEKRKRSSGSSLPADWSPPEELFTYGVTLGLTRDQSAEIIERMRLWAHGNKNRAVARKADWIATMQGALRRDAPKFIARAGPPRSDHRDGVATVFRETMERVRNNERQNKTGSAGDVLSLPVVPEKPRPNGFDVGGLLDGLKRFP